MTHGIFVRDGALRWEEFVTPTPGRGQVRIRIRATAVNRADLIQRTGHYPPPPGASEVLGLECAGEIEAVGRGVDEWKVGDRVVALLAGGGYAEHVVCPAGHALPLPQPLSFAEGAALPEVVCTAWLNLMEEAGVEPGHRVLLHAGASGVGTCAVQLCRLIGAEAFVTAGSAEKVARCRELGAVGGANRHEEDFAELADAWTDGHGFDVILCPVGAAYLEANLRVLATDGTMVLIGLMGGRRAEIDLGRLLVKRQRLVGSTLRARSDAFKTGLIGRIVDDVWPWVAERTLVPIIDRVLPIASVDEAFAAVASNETVGKVVLTVR